jgi:phage shock protein A
MPFLNRLDAHSMSKLSLKRLKKRLSTKVEEFRSIIEFIKARYSAAEAQVRIKEAVGISAEMTDVGIALDRAEDKRAKMKAKFQALD